MEHTRIMAAAFSAEDTELLHSLLADEGMRVVADIRPDSAGLRRAGLQSADALVICCSGTPDLEFDFAERLYMTRGDIAVVLVTPSPSADVIDRAMRAGVARVADMGEPPENIRRAVLSAVARERSRAAASTGAVSTYDNKMALVFCPKGGTGKTSVAVNLAVSLASLGKKVTLVDLDLQFGDVGIFLDIGNADTVAELVGEKTLDLKTVKSYLVRHHSGVSVLLAPAAPEYAELVTAEHVETILSILRSEADYLVVDMPPAFSDTSMAALELADSVFFVVTEEISAINTAKQCFKVFDALNVSEKARLVVNKDGVSTISVRDVEGILEMKSALVLPNDQKIAVKAINRGVPVVLGDKRSRLAQAMDAFAVKLIKED